MDSHSPTVSRTAGNQSADSGTTTLCAKIFGTQGGRFGLEKPKLGFTVDHPWSDHPRYHRTAPGYGQHT